jgi:hypothetical protein
MTWLAGTFAVLMTASGIGAIRAAVERGDLDEVARQGELAGPAVIARALAAPDRIAQLGGVIAAPAAEDAASLLPALAALSGTADRRTAIPAARAASRIAGKLARTDRDDDLAAGELATWHDEFLALALRGDRWIELRIAALDTAVQLAHARLDDAGATADADAAIGFPLVPVLADPDPAFRGAALVRMPQPLPAASRTALAGALANDPDPAVALAAAQAVCADLATDDPQPALAALAGAPLARLQALLAAPHLPALAVDDGTLRDAARCLAADASVASTSALATLTAHASPALRRALANLR